jgi:GntR family transcriptional regulator
MQQIRHAVDTGFLRRGDQLPGIRTLAEEIVISHNTVAKACSEVEHEGLVEIRHGSGAYISARIGSKSRSEKVRLAQQLVHALVKPWDMRLPAAFGALSLSERHCPQHPP